MKRTMVVVAIFSALTAAFVAFAVAALVQPTISRAGPAEQTAAPIVRAQRFELVDSNGTLRAVLGVGPSDNWTVLQLNDENGDVHIGMAVAADQAGMALGQGDLHSHIQMSLVGEEPAIQVRNEAGAVAVLGVKADGRLGYAGIDRTGQVRADVGLASNGQPRISLLDPTGGTVWTAP
jgi:hypothetical protein